MRRHPFAWTLTAAASTSLVGLALALAPSGSAQDACTAADPCPWFVDIESDGLFADDGPVRFNATLGDWYTLNATNYADDGQEHTLTLDRYGIVLRVPSLEAAETEPFQLDKQGTFALRDDMGHNGTILVTPGDVNDLEQGLVDEAGNPKGNATSPPSPTSKGMPAPSLGHTVAAVMAVAAVAGAVAGSGAGRRP